MQFITEQNASQSEAIRLLGVRVHLLPVEGLVARIVEAALAHQRAIVAYVNAQRPSTQGLKQSLRR